MSVLHSALAGRQRRTIPPALPHRLAVIALAAIPDGVTEIGRLQHVPEALSYIANHVALEPGRQDEILAQVNARGLLVHGQPAGDALRLTGPRPRKVPIRDRSWRKVRGSLNGNRELTSALLQVLAEDLGADPLAWAILDRLGREHTGTVGELTVAAAAVAAVPVSS